jgi:hypothetical protein
VEESGRFVCFKAGNIFFIINYRLVNILNIKKILDYDALSAVISFHI